jgi:tetratricopeptide (TPR) repeat protein
MRSVFAFSIGTLLVISPALTMAQEQAPVEQQAALPNQTLAQKRAARLDDLFASLKRESNEVKAARIASLIQLQWQNSGSATVDLMMGWAAKAMEEKKYSVALDFLDQVVVMKPDYAEGWNRRATLHFMMNDYGRSMADIQKTLTLEPRHFGAMAGMAAILKDTGRKEAALQAFERVLTVYPMMREAQKQAGELADELTGQRT